MGQYSLDGNVEFPDTNPSLGCLHAFVHPQEKLLYLFFPARLKGTFYMEVLLLLDVQSKMGDPVGHEKIVDFICVAE